MGSPNIVHVFQFPINGGATTLTAFPSSKCQGDRGHTAVCPLSAARAVPLCRLSIVPRAATRDDACNSACGAREKRSDPVHRMSASAWSRCIVNVWPCAGLIVRSMYLYSRACTVSTHRDLFVQYSCSTRATGRSAQIVRGSMPLYRYFRQLATLSSL